jgi:HK97 family phage prohead protease
MSPVTLRAPEMRTYQLRLADVDTTASLSYLEGRAVPYGTETMVGWYWEQMAAQVFADSLKSRSNLPLLLWHNGRTWPVGVAHEWHDRDDGLHGVWRLDSGDDAQRAARMAADGILTGLSVGFDPRTSKWTYTPYDEWDPDDPATYDRVTRQTARLAEVSLVPAPAYDDAAVTLVRSAERRIRRGARPQHPAGRLMLTRAASTVPAPAAASRPHLDYWRAVRDTLNAR